MANISSFESFFRYTIPGYFFLIPAILLSRLLVDFNITSPVTVVLFITIGPLVGILIHLVNLKIRKTRPQVYKEAMEKVKEENLDFSLPLEKIWIPIDIWLRKKGGDRIYETVRRRWILISSFYSLYITGIVGSLLLIIVLILSSEEIIRIFLLILALTYAFLGFSAKKHSNRIKDNTDVYEKYLLDLYWDEIKEFIR